MSTTPTRSKHGSTSFLSCGKGEVIVLVHGLHGTASTWEGVARRLAPSFRVIAPDMLGFGESDSPEIDGYMEEQAHAIHRLLGSLGVERAYFVGHDFGGPVVMTLFRLYPGMTIRGVVLSNTNMFIDTPVPFPLRSASVPILGHLFYRLMAGSRFGLWMTYQMAVIQKQQVDYTMFSAHVDARNLRTTQAIFQRSLSNLPKHYSLVERQLKDLKARLVDCNT